MMESGISQLSLLAGEMRPASGPVVELFNPATGEAIGSVRLAEESDIDIAAEAAEAAFAGGWGATAPAERGRLLHALARAIRENAESLIRIEIENSGHSRAFAERDAETAARYFEYYAGVADKLMGSTIPINDDILDYTLIEPYGVCAVITPFNAPLQMLSRSTAPALAAGNAVIVKPTEQAPAASMALAKVLHEAGVPSGVLNVLPGGAAAGQRLVTHPAVQHVTFTGSVPTGIAIMRAAAESVTPVTLELGGKSPHLIFADADLDAAIEAIVATSLVTTGQICMAGTRLLVEEPVAEEFERRLAARVAKVTVGPPAEGCEMGPVISAIQRDRIVAAIEAAQATDARLLAGGPGHPEGAPEHGFYVKPTVFSGVDPASRLAQEELFGPVLAVTPFRTFEEAIEYANATEYGLAAGVWSESLSIAHQAARRLQSGQVYINNYGAGGGVELPFGGYKMSGIGREKGMAALREYTQIKNVCVKIG